MQKYGTDYFLNRKKIILVKDQSEFLCEYYDAPETGYRGQDAFFAKITWEYAGISQWDIAKWLKNWETKKYSPTCKESENQQAID
jgi:hypothetical protein